MLLRLKLQTELATARVCSYKEYIARRSKTILVINYHTVSMLPSSANTLHILTGQGLEMLTLSVKHGTTELNANM
jgi:hypothetical protein